MWKLQKNRLKNRSTKYVLSISIYGIFQVVFHLKPGLAFRAKKVRWTWKSDLLFLQPSRWLEDLAGEPESPAIWTAMRVCSVSSSYTILKHMQLFVTNCYLIRITQIIYMPHKWQKNQYPLCIISLLFWIMQGSTSKYNSVVTILFRQQNMKGLIFLPTDADFKGSEFHAFLCQKIVVIGIHFKKNHHASKWLRKKTSCIGSKQMKNK